MIIITTIICTYILVVDHLHQHQFSVSSLCMSDILEWPAQFLDGNFHASDSIISSTVHEHQREPLISFSKMALVIIENGAR